MLPSLKKRAGEWLRACALLACSCVPIERDPIGAEPVPSGELAVLGPDGGNTAVPPGAAPPASTASTAPEPTLGMPIGHVVIGPDRKVPMVIQNTKLARLRVLRVTVNELAATAPLVGVHPGNADPLAKLPRALKQRIKVQPLAQGSADADVFAIAGGELVLGVLEAPGAMSRVAVFQRGELSVLLKTGGTSGLVWVTSTRTGKPVASAEVVIQQGGSVRHRVHTDRDGIARLPAEQRLRLPYVAAMKHEDFEQPLMAIARSGKHVALASERWQTGLESWQFGLPEIYYTGQDALRGTVSSERGIYRPGERVHLLGVLRQRLSNGKLAPPPGKVKVRITDPDGSEVFSDDVALNQFGTFRSELPIARAARLGRYSVVVTKATAELRSRFEVGEYRPVRFEVTLPVQADAAGDTIEIPITARYLYGAPVPNAAVRWTVSGRAQRQFGAWSEGYSFTSESAGVELLGLAEGEAKLDAAGQTKISVPRSNLDPLSSSQAVELAVEASVQDAAGDVVSGRTVQSLLRTPALLGLRSDAWVVSPKQGWTVKLLVADAAGAPRAGKKVKLELVRKKWMSVAEEHAGEARYRGEWQDDVVATREVTSGTKPLDVHFALPAGGQYRIQASLDGEEASANETVWAYGSDAYGAWDNHARMALHSDKTSYQPGERAKIYAEVPYAKAWALVTLEREGVLEARTMKLEGSGTPIEVALTERQIPNVFASVAVVPEGLGSGAPAAGPPLRLGYQELQVSAERRRLKVDVRPASTQTRPGESVDVRVRVSDSENRPARAEITLWAADEGVLKLTGYATPDPFAPAYERHSHQVRTAASLLRFVSSVADGWDEYGGDSGPAEDAGAAFRSRFLGTAFFSKGVVTDARGEALVRVPLPDNLTRWRVMAAVADSGDRFGSAQASIETSKPLQIEPALPRFLTRGDELDATLLVHNQTKQRGTAVVTLDVKGAELKGAGKQKLEIDAGAQLPVRFALRAGQVGNVRVRASAELGKERDAFQVELPVHAPTLWQTELVGEGRLDEARKIELKMPASAEPGLAELTVSVGPGVLAALSGGVDALLDYPHGCVEQTTSRLIPMVLLEEILRSSGDARLSGKGHRQKMEQAVAHVLKHQNGDGGFGLWPDSASEGFLTAYALWGLLTAQEHGYGVPTGAIRRGVAYLKTHAESGDDMHGQFSSEDTQPFAAFVLAAAKQDDSGLGTKLVSEKKGLSRFGLGLLGAAFAERDSSEAKPLLGELSTARKKTALGSLIAEASTPSSELFEYGRDLRATAALVRALAMAGRGRDADDLVAGILGERRSDGSWGTTYNNLWALHALVDYGTHGNRGAASGRVRITSAKTRLATLDVTPKSRLKTALVAAPELPFPGKSARIELSGPKGSSIRFAARLRWAAAVSAQKPIDRGFSVKRELFDAGSGAPVTTPAQGQLLRVRLTLTTAEDREQVALIDRLPAGFEAVDTALATSGSDPDAGSAADSDDTWVWRELHDERVTHFADHLGSGSHEVEYLVRATRSGTFVRPAASAEAMYAPDIFGHGAVESVTVKR